MTNPDKPATNNTNSQSVYSVPAFFMRFLLETSQEHLTPRFFHNFIQETGLARFEHDLPPLNGELVATRDEASAFVAKIYGVTGEGVYPLFGHNLGLSIAKMSFNTPLLQALKAKTEPVAKDTSLSLSEKLVIIAKILDKAFQLQGQHAHAENNKFLIESRGCIYCHAIKTDEMVCYVDKTVFTTMLKWLTGWTFIGEQTLSVARGDPACAFCLTPIDYDRIK